MIGCSRAGEATDLPHVAALVDGRADVGKLSRMLDPKSVKVSIFGHEYTLKGEAEPGYVEQVAQFVDRRMREVAEGAALVSTTKVAILAALNIADELFRERKKRQEALAMLDDRTGQIAALLEKEVDRI